jgi:hypothetical protein
MDKSWELTPEERYQAGFGPNGWALNSGAEREMAVACAAQRKQARWLKQFMTQNPYDGNYTILLAADTWDIMCEDLGVEP